MLESSNFVLELRGIGRWDIARHKNEYLALIVAIFLLPFFFLRLLALILFKLPYFIILMYTFKRYDPSLPRNVCSFKGNQKLIFEGYRYNIHHIVPLKGVKTWRCVCAKKLNGTRTWCKGRAETWDNDKNGMSKGEHNHPPEHEIAELEYFKSQLIVAAIECPQANLTELINEAASLMMTGGSNFGNRESLKKSLAGARRQAENGGFKLKCYKNICYNKTTTIRNRSIIQLKKEETTPKSYNINDILNKKIIFDKKGIVKLEEFSKNNEEKKIKEEEEGKEEEEENSLNLFKKHLLSSSSLCSSSSSSTPSSNATSSALFFNNKLFSSSNLSSSNYSSSPSSTFSLSSPTCYSSNSSFLNSSSSPSSKNSNLSFKDSPYFNSSFSSSSSSLSSSNAFLMAIIAAATNSSNKNLIKEEEKKQLLLKKQKEDREEEEKRRKQQILVKKKARINFVFNRLSRKVTEAVSNNAGNNKNLIKNNLNEIEIKHQQKENCGERFLEENVKNNCKEFGTQTDELTNYLTEEEDNKNNGANLILVCCCEDKQKCTQSSKRHKRKLLTPRMLGNNNNINDDCGDLSSIAKEDF
uniref:FLYWCH-type domain-containing protein n=1 Tax=Meloidogyne incognita TaxID=6306 RepID=A0A914L852_MELIC